MPRSIPDVRRADVHPQYAQANVSATLDLCNNTREPGNWFPTGCGLDPYALAYDRGKGEVFVANSASNNVSIVLDSTNKVVATVPVGNDPEGVAYDSGKGEIFVANDNCVPSCGQGSVSVISDTTDKVVATVTVGTGPLGLTYDSGMGEVFVANEYSDNVSVISDATNTVVASIDVGTYPESAAYDPTRGYVYVANQNTVSDSVSVVSDSTNSVVATVSVGGHPTSVTYDSGTGDVVVANSGSDSYSVIADTTVVLTRTVAIGVWGVVYDSGTSEIFAENGNSPGNVSVIPDTIYGVVATVPVGYAPQGMTYDSGTGEVFLADQGDGALSILSSGPPVGGPTISAFTAQPSTIPAGGTTFLNVSASGGTGTLTYAYVALPPGCTSANLAALACAPSATGTFTPKVYVNDSSGHSAAATTTFSVAGSGGSPTINSFSVSPSTVAVGSLATFSVSATGGTGTLSYQYADLPPGCSTTDTPTLGCTPSAPGTFQVVVYVNDTAGHSTHAATILVVTSGGSGPTITSFSASPASLAIGSNTTLSVAATGGVGSLAYAYQGLPGGCSSADSPSLLCHPLVAGTYTVRAYVNDSASHSATATTSVSVAPAGGGPVISSFTVSPSSVEVLQQATFLVSAGGGTAPLAYAFVGLPSGCLTSDGASLTCSPTASGDFTVRVYVNDSRALSATATASLTVTPESGGSGITISSFGASPSTVLSGSPTTFSVAASGGSGTLGYAYAGLPAGCASANSASWSCTPTASGTFSVRVYVNDTHGDSATTTAALTVSTSSPTGTLASVAISPVSASVSIEATQTFTAETSCTGGPCPTGWVDILWSLNSSAGTLSSTTSNPVTFTAGPRPGAITLEVVASFGTVARFANATLTITGVTSGPTPARPSFLGLPQDEGYALLAILVGVVVVLLVGFVVVPRRRKRRLSNSGSTGRSGPTPSELHHGSGPPST